MQYKIIQFLIFAIFSFTSLANGFSTGESEHKKGNYAEALTIFNSLADQGNANAQNSLGSMYANGQGVTKDERKAVSWYRKAAEQGNANAQNSLGDKYGHGKGVAINYKVAANWYLKSAEQGNANAQFNLGYMYTHHYNHRNGYKRGVPKDYKEALRWFRKSADQGHAMAQVNLGHSYREGDGVARDYKEAVRFYRKAAEQGHPWGQINLGNMYKYGKGVVKDYKETAKWYRKAADQGDNSAIYDLAGMYRDGKGVAKDYEEALRLYGRLNSGAASREYIALEKLILMEKKMIAENCTTKIFNVAIKCADRDYLTVSIKKVARSKREDKTRWSDVYYTKNILKGSRELVVEYTVDDFFARARYTFPSSMDTNQITNVRSFVENKYGEPDYLTDHVSSEKVSYQWNMDDGIELKISRDSPNATTYLSFTYPKNYRAMLDEQKKQKKAREAKEYESQNDVF